MTRTLDLPGQDGPGAVAEAAQVILANTQDPRQVASLAWRWGLHVHPDDRQAAERAYFAVLAAARIEPPSPTADPEPDPEPAKPEPEPDADADADPDPDPEPQPTRAPVAAPDPDPLTDTLTQQLTMLAERVAEAEPHVAAQVERWDPDDQPSVAGQVAIVEWADLRQRAGPTRIIVLHTRDGPIEIWASWQQLAALLRAQELAHGRTLQAGDLIGIQARGKQRVGRSRSPSRMFTVAIEWTP